MHFGNVSFLLSAHTIGQLPPPDRPDIARWPELCADFLHRLGW